MTVQSIMSTDIQTLKPDDRVADALVTMCREQIHNMPVLDEQGNFIGLFSLRRVTHALLPAAAQLNQDLLLMDLRFMPDDPDKLMIRLKKIGQKPVSELLEKKKKLRFCSPDTPIPEMLLLLSENPISLPVLVVEGKKKHLRGMVSSWDVLTKIAVNLLAGDSSATGEARSTPEVERE